MVAGRTVDKHVSRIEGEEGTSYSYIKELIPSGMMMMTMMKGRG